MLVPTPIVVSFRLIGTQVIHLALDLLDVVRGHQVAALLHELILYFT